MRCCVCAAAQLLCSSDTQCGPLAASAGAPACLAANCCPSSPGHSRALRHSSSGQVHIQKCSAAAEVELAHTVAVSRAAEKTENRWQDTPTGAKYAPLVRCVNACEAAISQLSDAELRGKTDEFRRRLAASEWPEPTDFERAGILASPAPPSESTGLAQHWLTYVLKLCICRQTSAARWPGGQGDPGRHSARGFCRGQGGCPSRAWHAPS